MGYSEEGRQRLHPEEALYLLECVSGVLEACVGKGLRLRNGKDTAWWTRRNSEFRVQ